MAKLPPPPRNQPLVNEDRTPSKRTAQFLEILTREETAISDVSLTAPSANETLLETAINDILSALRAKGFIQE